MHHDVIAGAATGAKSNLTTYFVRCSFFSIEFLNNMMPKFNFAGCDKADKQQLLLKQDRRQTLK